MAENRDAADALSRVHRKLERESNLGSAIAVDVMRRKIDHPVQIGGDYVPLPTWVLEPDQVLHIARKSDEIQSSIVIHVARDYLVTTCQIRRECLFREVGRPHVD